MTDETADMMVEVKKAIREKLPAQVSEELQQYLREADQAKRDAIELRKKNEELIFERDKLKALDIRKADLDTREQTLKDDRQKHELEKRDYRIKCLEEKYIDVKSLMHDVFRNQRLVYRKTENESRQWTDNTGICHYDNKETQTDTDKVEE